MRIKRTKKQRREFNEKRLKTALDFRLPLRHEVGERAGVRWCSLFSSALRTNFTASGAPKIALLTAFCLLFGLAIAADQQPSSTMKGFKAPLEYFEPPHELQVKTYLEGANSEMGANGAIVIWDAKLLTYHEDGTQEMIVNAPQCFYNQHTVNSSGPLQVQTWDDKNKRALRLQGSNGFYWQQTNSLLIVSNHQSTIISGSLTNSFTP